MIYHTDPNAMEEFQIIRLHLAIGWDSGTAERQTRLSRERNKVKSGL